MSHDTNSQQPVIEVKNLSKKYTISHEQKAEYGSFRDTLVSLVKRPFEKKGQHFGAEEKHEEFWALKDISFEVQKGEIFGVIGRNGSGKSTLLKTLSRIITPTTGEAIIRGTTASLLEVGTGFHPELTGRENIFFNGSMLGMSRDEIGKKFDEIVKFAEIEKFLDTPVKFYSSGMYVRLAFSVAAHLEPDVLILDEVLAVGDEAFQRKSLNKILQTIHTGTTVLFVSHSMGSVAKLCSRGLLLDKGRVDFIGDVEELVDKYNQRNAEDISKTSEAVLSPHWHADGKLTSDTIEARSMALLNSDLSKVDGPLKNNEEHHIDISFDIKSPLEQYYIGIVVANEYNTPIFVTANRDVVGLEVPRRSAGMQTVRFTLPAHYLNSGIYKASLFYGIHGKVWYAEPESQESPSIKFQIDGGLSDSPEWKVPRSGYMAPVFEWKNVDKESK